MKLKNNCHLFIFKEEKDFEKKNGVIKHFTTGKSKLQKLNLNEKSYSKRKGKICI